MGGMEDVFELLDREWHLLRDSSRTRRAFRQWRLDHPVLLGVTSAHEAARIARSAHHVQDRYAMTAALLDQAASCDLAERTLIQAQIPAMRNLSYRARGWSADRLKVSYGLRTGMEAGRVSRLVWADLDAIAIAGVAEFIRLHAGEPLPYVGLKMRDHSRNRLRSFVWSELRRTHAESQVARQSHETRPNETHRNPSAELLELLALAREQGLLTLGDLRLIVGNRLLGISDRQLAESTQVSPATANRQRARVERRLVTAFAP